ncbi:hypothetical protein [Paraburkholderia domus]|uniref:VgrG-related protein n=1 Tax=Paraburkholderia domus TaxID=2793075 RepID=UPI00191208B3|nr:hypothetical protein [Paraburkholderia domus]MBK5061826.1 hypothetical protein [Burkholderia sp. R-70199]CAE6901245.1 hypothetical protein R70199_03706 [Paraburkholderia domus]
MALKSDAYGFLVGAPVEWGRALQIFNEIRDEVRALRGDIAGGASIKALERAADAVSRQAQAVTRTSTSKAVTRSATPPRPQAPARAPKPPAAVPSRATPVRGPNGRFMSASAAKAASAPIRQAPQSAAKSSGGIQIIDRASLGNRRDADAFSDETRATVGKALASGKKVFYYIEGKPYEIVSAEGGRLKDAKGQQWGLSNLLMPAKGDHSRLEIHGGAAAPTIRKPYQIPVSADAGSAPSTSATATPTRSAADVRAAIDAQNLAMSQSTPKKPAATPTKAKGKPAAPVSPVPAANPSNPVDPEQDEIDKSNAEYEKNKNKKRRQGKEGASVAGTANGAIANAPEIDPSIVALHEVQAAVAPIGRGLNFIFSSGNNGLLNRMFGKAKGSTPFEKAELKVLTQIRDNTNLGGGKGGGGLLGGLLGGIPGFGMLGRVLGAGARGAGGLASLALRGGKGLFRRIPLLGALFAGGSAAASIAGFGDDPNASPEENRVKRFTGAGSGIGALVGGGIGTLLGGPVGSIIGGMVGDKVGELVGKWLSTLDWAKIGATITGAWDAAVKGFSAEWDDISGWFKDKFGMVKNAANKANDYVNEKTGIDVKATTGEVAKAVSIVAKDTADVAKKAVGATTGYVADRVKKMAAPIVNAGKAAKDWALGKTSQFFESGTRGAAAISTGKGDHGGASYGTYQLASAGGAKSTLNKFLASSGYASQFAGLTPGSPEFNAKWKQIAASDPAFGAAQHDFIKSTHFDPQMVLLGKSGIDLSKRGAAVQDAVWSTSVQFGGQTSLIKSALAGKDTSKMSDAEIVTAIQNYKIAHNSDLFRSSSASTQASTLNRASVERSRLLALAQPLPSPSTSPGINVPAVADAAQSVPTSLGKPPAVEVRVSKDASDVGPTVSDPKIARLVSGGLSQ